MHIKNAFNVYIKTLESIGNLKIENSTNTLRLFVTSNYEYTPLHPLRSFLEITAIMNFIIRAPSPFFILCKYTWKPVG